MFSLLVSADPTAWETDQKMRMRHDRFMEYSRGSEAKAISLQRPDTLMLLNKTHAILMYERGARSVGDDPVRFGTLQDVEDESPYVSFRFVEMGRFSRSEFVEFSTRLGIDENEYGRIHWAIKDGDLPSDLYRRLMRTYDVVFSFAEAQRPYVERVAGLLREKGLSVFYDNYEVVELWGKDLVEHFDRIYRSAGKFCVMFISAQYASSMWTRLERRSAFARALQSRHEYILPARFDDSQLDGLSPSTHYITCGDKSADDFAHLLLQKVRGAAGNVLAGGKSA